MAAAALALAGCGAPAAAPTPTPEAPSAPASATPEPTPEATPTPTPTPVAPSNNLDAITVGGTVEAPEVTVPAPWAIDETRRKVITPGTGPEATAESIIEVHYLGVNGRTGEVFDASRSKPGSAPAVMSLQQVVPGFTKGLTGAKVGERVLIAMPGADGYDSSGGSPQAGIQVGDSLVFLVDVRAVSLTGAAGARTNATLPVTLGEADGKPTVTIPPGAAAPTAPVVATVIKGEQREVAADDYVMVRYRAYAWGTGDMVEDKFDAPEAGQLNETIEAWKQGLPGQTIGSRVVLVAPNAYPTGSEDPKVAAGEAVVYVVDVLFATSAA